MLEFVALQRPGIALGAENRRAGSIERTQGLHQRRVMLRFGDGVEVVRIGAKVNKGCGAVGIFPGDYEDRVLGGAFSGPLGEHHSIILSALS